MRNILLLLTAFTSSCLLGYNQTVSTLIGPDIGINDGIAIDSEGNLYGTDHGGYEVYKYSNEGELTEITTFDNHPNAILVDDESNIYVSTPQGNKIFRIDIQGNIEQYGPEIPNPNGLIFQKNSDTLIVTSYLHNTISKLAPDGGLVTWIDDDQLNGPLGLVYDNNNNLYVSNFNDGKMFQINNGVLEYFATVPGAYLGNDYFSTGYITFLDGYIYATGYATNKVYRVNLEGEVYEFAGSGIAGYLDGDASMARFFYPNGIVPSVTGDSLLISGYENHIVRIVSEIDMQSNWSKVDASDIILYPNPFTNSASLSYNLNKPSIVDIRIYDLFGREVYCLINRERRESGKQIEDIKLEQNTLLPSVYYLIATINDNKSVQKIILK